MSLKIYRKYFTIVAIIWVVCLIPFALIYMIALAPQQKSQKQVENQLAEIKQTYDSAAKASLEETKTRQKEEIKNLQNKLKDFTVDFEDSANLTFDISQIANEKKVGSFSIKMQEGIKGAAARTDLKHLQENQININFEGDFNQFASFLNALERNQPVVFVDNFKITRSQRDDSGHKVNMKLAVFVRKQQDS
ncbi:MAG: type 4a pilus biogenesis protein PilO [Planctomycetota bacterium]